MNEPRARLSRLSDLARDVLLLPLFEPQNWVNFASQVHLMIKFFFSLNF
jgi:hypothetical protein